MPPKPSDPHEKALAAGAQLQEALLTAAKALTTIADIVPNLFPEAAGSAAPQRAASLSPVVNRRVIALKDDTSDTTPQSNKRKRTQKDPDAPEKPLSAYHLYAKEKREQVKNTMGSASSASDVVHEINRMWKDLSDELKKVQWHLNLADNSHSSTQLKSSKKHTSKLLQTMSKAKAESQPTSPRQNRQRSPQNPLQRRKRRPRGLDSLLSQRRRSLSTRTMRLTTTTTTTTTRGMQPQSLQSSAARNTHLLSHPQRNKRKTQPNKVTATVQRRTRRKRQRTKRKRRRRDERAIKLRLDISRFRLLDYCCGARYCRLSTDNAQ
jgi:hypothetical protein